MAVSRRSSQQQQSTIQSPPRNSSLIAGPPGSPPMALLTSNTVPPEGERECSGGMEISLASPDQPAAVLASSASSTTTTSGGGSSVSSPGSGCTSPTDGSSGIGGAFRELFEACRNGDVSRVKRLVDSVNVNAKDMAGRKSTPLHFAAGKLTPCRFIFVADCAIYATVLAIAVSYPLRVAPSCIACRCSVPPHLYPGCTVGFNGIVRTGSA